MSVRTRLLCAFALVTVVMLVPSLFAASRLSTLSRIAIDGRTNHAAAVTSLGRMQALVTDLDRLERSFLATRDPGLADLAKARADSLRSVYETFRSSPYGHLASKLGPVVDDIGTLSSGLVPRVREGRLDDAAEQFEILLTTFQRAGRQFAAVASSIDAQAAAELSRADALSARGRMQTLLGVGAALVLALLFTGLTTHRLTDPLRRLGRAMAAVADGTREPRADLPYDRNDEIGELSTSFDIMTRRLAALDRKKSEFLGMVSHELKTPINVITVYSEMLTDEAEGLSECHAKMLGDVAEQARVMASRVSRLMDLSRLEAGAYELQFESVRLADFVADVESAFARLALDKGVGLRTSTSERVPDEVVMDGDIIRDEVLGNLITNAVRHTPEGGRVEVLLDGDEHGIHFVVSDSGPGIPEEHRPHIFRKHYVADRTRAVGSGLGLAIAKEMVELHGGVIKLEDPRHQSGACFRVSLPLEPHQPEVELPAPSFLTRHTRASRLVTTPCEVRA